MNNKEYSIKEALEVLECSRSTLYKNLDKKGIKPVKRGRIAYIKHHELELLKKTVSNQKDKNKKHTTTDKTEDTTEFIKHLQQQLQEEQKKNSNLEGEIKGLTLEIGRWQGRAKTLEEQNKELLTLPSPKQNNILTRWIERITKR